MREREREREDSSSVLYCVEFNILYKILLAKSTPNIIFKSVYITYLPLLHKNQVCKPIVLYYTHIFVNELHINIILTKTVSSQRLVIASQIVWYIIQYYTAMFVLRDWEYFSFNHYNILRFNHILPMFYRYNPIIIGVILKYYIIIWLLSVL